MIVEMRTGATKKEVDDVVQKAKSLDLGVQLNVGTDKTVVAILGSNTGQIPTDIFAVFPGVESVTRIMKPYKLASRAFRPKDTKVICSGVEIGGERIVVIAGPCARPAWTLTIDSSIRPAGRLTTAPKRPCK